MEINPIGELMNGKNIFQWGLVVLAGSCVLVLIRSCSSREKRLITERVSQPLYREVLATRRAAEPVQPVEIDRKRWTEPMRTPKTRVQDVENTNDVSYQEIR